MHEYLMIAKAELNHIQKQKKQEEGGRAYIYISTYVLIRKKSEFDLKRRKMNSIQR